MKNINKNVLVALLVGALMSTNAFAADDISSMINKLSGIGPALASAFSILFYVSGLWFAGTGIKDFIQAQKGQGQVSVGSAATKFIIGVFLIFLPYLLNLSGNQIGAGTGGTEKTSSQKQNGDW
jgi:hypothetical protein